MILGSFNTSGNTGSPSLVADLVKKSLLCNLTFFSLSRDGFSGGFFIHDRLPYRQEDFYYQSNEDGLFVLLSGSVHNRTGLSALCNIGGKVPDPELIAHLFMSEGPGLFNRLNGDFAVFIAEPGGKGAYLLRDHVGIRPLAYTFDDDTLVFSTDITGLSRAVSGGDLPDEEYLLSPFRFTDRSKAPDSRVKKMLPGHYLHFTTEGATLTRYWQPDKITTDRRMKHETMVNDLQEIVHDAVAIRSDKRFRAGAHVSSGLDSAVVSAMAKKEYSCQDIFYGFSWSPLQYEAAGARYDERDLVKKLCDHTGITPVFSQMSTDEYIRYVSDYYYNRGYFSEDGVLSQAAGQGVNLLFSGWGGDEFISTGDRGIEIDLLRNMHLCTFFRRSRIRHPRLFIHDLFYYVINPVLGILDRRVAMSFRENARYLKKGSGSHARKDIKDFYYHTSRRQAHLRLLRMYHLQERCEAEAVMGYRKGIEYRYPLLDRRIIEYMLTVPSKLLCLSGMYRPLLRLISEGIVPDEIRLHYDKIDPVYQAFNDDLIKTTALRFIEETGYWSRNPGLDFIDFSLLAKDMEKYKAGTPSVGNKVLFNALVNIKAINEFTHKYRGNE